MDLDKVFKEPFNFEDLWTRLQTFSDELNLQPEDEQIFTADEQAKLSFYINNYFNNMVAVGSHLARVRKIKNRLEEKKQRIFGALYVKITNECIDGRNSSKYDKDYRTGKVLENSELREITKLLIDVTELEGILEAVKSSLQTKSMVLPTMFKLDKYQY